MAQVQEVMFDGFSAPVLKIGNLVKELEVNNPIPVGMGSLVWDGISLVRFAGSGKEKFRIKLERPGRYVLHHDFGYRKKDVEEMSPLEPIRNDFKIKKSSVSAWTEQRNVTQCLQDLRGPEGTKRQDFLTDGDQEFLYHRGETAIIRVTPGTYLVEIEKKVVVGGGITTIITGIHLRDQSDETVAKVREAILSA